METPTLRTSQDITTNILWSIDITIFIWTQGFQSAVETPTLRTSQDITTYIYIFIFIFIENDLLTQLYLFEHRIINQLWRPPHLEHPKTLQHTYVFIFIMIYWHNCYQHDLLTEKITWTSSCLWCYGWGARVSCKESHLEHPSTYI